MGKENKIEKKFIKDWGKELADKVKEAAESHRNEVNGKNIGEYFKWALLICIGYQCLEIPEYREYHNIPNLNWNKMKKWIRDNAELGTYQGDCDYLSIFSGKYNYFMPKQKSKKLN